MINRDDMLELTRRMTLERSNFSRIAGCYVDEDGFIDGTFNTSFLKLDAAERKKKLALAKAVPFGRVNEELCSYSIPQQKGQEDIYQLLEGIRLAELKNDAVLDILYEMISEHYHPGYAYGIFVFYSAYDVPSKGADHASQWESEEVYQHMIVAIAPTEAYYEAEEVTCGFLYPSFWNRSEDRDHIAFYTKAGNRADELLGLLNLK